MKSHQRFVNIIGLNCLVVQKILQNQQLFSIIGTSSPPIEIRERFTESNCKNTVVTVDFDLQGRHPLPTTAWA